MSLFVQGNTIVSGKMIVGPISQIVPVISPTPTITVTPTITPSSNIITSNLILDYNFESVLCYPGSGTTVFDLSFPQYNGTLFNSPIHSYSDGGNFDFNGTNQYIEIPHNSAIKPTSGITIEQWLKPDDWNDGVWPSAYLTPISCTQGGGYAFYLGSGIIVVYVRAGGTYQIVSGSTSTLNGWNSITTTFDGRYTKLYINGSIVDTEDMGTSNNPIQYAFNNSLLIGAEAGASTLPAGFYWNGKISITRLYNVALNDSQILQNYNFSSTQFIEPTPVPTSTPTPTITITPTTTITPTPSITPNLTITPTVSLTQTITPTLTVTPTISVTPSITPSSAAAVFYSNFEQYIINGVRQATTYQLIRTNISAIRRLVVTETITFTGFKFLRIPPDNWSTISGYAVTGTLSVVTGTIDGGSTSKSFNTKSTIANPSNTALRANNTSQYDTYDVRPVNNSLTTLTPGEYNITLFGTSANMSIATLTNSVFPIDTTKKIYPSLTAATTHFAMQVF